jgi:NADH-quinone oxidoreductase subunit M
MMVILLLFLPLLGALVTLLFKNGTAKTVALLFALAELAVAVTMLTQFVPDATTQFGVNYAWIPAFGIHFKAGVDGISMIMVLLTTVLVPIIILSTFKQSDPKPALYALILFMQAGLLVVFTALDGFLFYVGWEAALIPIYFICALWGGADRVRITLKFFIYTFAGSLFMLLGLIYLYMQTPGKTFDLQAFYALNLDASRQSVIFWAFFLAFAIKMPIFPFHTWQPDTYTESPTAGTMMLSGIMLKMGIYGVIRWLIPISPLGFEHWGCTAIVLSVIGVVYAALIAFNQKDGKRLIAYSSISHVGLIAAGIFAWNVEGVQGAMIQMLSHGINVIGMFFIMDIISRRLNTRDITQLGGIAKVAPQFAIAFLIIILGTAALPLTNGFIGEFLLLNGVYQYNIWMAAVAGLTIIFAAVYLLRMYKKVMQGETNALTLTFTDITGSEKAVLGIICLLIIGIGVYPNWILHISEASVTSLIDQVNQKLIVK